MEFDKTKIYTAVNADEVKVGSKGYFADSLAYLRRQIEENRTVEQVKEIIADSNPCRFVSENRGEEVFQLFYLVKTSKESCRPYGVSELKKYIVHGNTGEDYCTDAYTIFGIFDSEEEAEQFILDYNKRAEKFRKDNAELFRQADESLRDNFREKLARNVIDLARDQNLVAFIQRDENKIELFEFEINSKRPVDTYIHVFDGEPLVAMYAYDG